MAESDRPSDMESAAKPDDTTVAWTIDQLPNKLRQAVRGIGWEALTPVQARAIPIMLEKRDLIVQSHTGSGKTGAFVLPMLELLEPDRALCQALVLTPTRELAVQVCREAERLAAGSGLRAVPVYGGVGYGPQMDALKKGAHIVVGTPGRVLDHLMRRSLVLNDLKFMVFDEADRMMSMGFYPDMLRVKSHLSGRQSTYMFSATFPPEVRRLAERFMRNPETLSLSHENVHVTDTEHVYYVVPPMDKDRSLVRVIEVENPSSAIVFCNTKQQVHYVATVLQRFGYDADELTSDLPQKARERVLDRARRGALRLLVATDVAARGIDIADLSHVFLYDVPEDPESYIHRAGRTGRAGAAGVAISLVTGVEEMGLRRISKRYNIGMEKRTTPTDEEVQPVVAERAIAQLEAKLRDRDKLKRERMGRFLPLAKSLGESDDELALIAMLLDDYYQDAQNAKTVPAIQAEDSSDDSDAPSHSNTGSDSGAFGRRPRPRSRGRRK